MNYRSAYQALIGMAAGCVLGACAAWSIQAVGAAPSIKIPENPWPTTTSTTEAPSTTTTSTTMVRPTTTTTVPRTTTTTVLEPYSQHVLADGTVDMCGRGENYPTDHYTEPVPQGTPGDPRPDPHRCWNEYEEWVRRETETAAVSHCVFQDQGLFDWVRNDPAYTLYIESTTGWEWVCIGMHPNGWMLLHGHPRYP